MEHSDPKEKVLYYKCKCSGVTLQPWAQVPSWILLLQQLLGYMSDADGSAFCEYQRETSVQAVY